MSSCHMWACRVHTMALPAVDKLGHVFRGADLEASISVLAVNMAAKVQSPLATLLSPCLSTYHSSMLPWHNIPLIHTWSLS